MKNTLKKKESILSFITAFLIGKKQCEKKKMCLAVFCIKRQHDYVQKSSLLDDTVILLNGILTCSTSETELAVTDLKMYVIRLFPFGSCKKRLYIRYFIGWKRINFFTEQWKKTTMLIAVCLYNKV